MMCRNTTLMCRGATARAGITLLEVILAMAILAGAMFMIGELTRIGARHADAALALSQGQLHCQSVLAQIDAGILTATPVQNAVIDYDANWMYSIDVEQQEMLGLIAVKIIATRVDDASPRPLQATMVRWMVDPMYLQQRLDEAAEKAAEEDTSVL